MGEEGTGGGGILSMEFGLDAELGRHEVWERVPAALGLCRHPCEQHRSAESVEEEKEGA